MKRDEVAIGDHVVVSGYGGFAEVLHIEEDGISPNGLPKYRVTVKWGPNNDTPGTSKRSRLIEDFALGKCDFPNAQETNTAQERRLERLDDMDEAQLMARLAELRKVGC